MKRVRFTEEQIIAVLREHEAGAKTADLARKHGISEATLYNWKALWSAPVGKRLLALDLLVCINLSMVRPRSASVFWPLDLLVCINLSMVRPRSASVFWPLDLLVCINLSMVRPRSASVFWPLDLLVCINLSGLLLELCVLLAMMGSARPRPS